MTAFPDIQKRAQDELDDVVGRDRMPTFSDYEHLHYIRAIVEEIFRWRPVTPIGVSHRVSEDDEYEGYHIPKGALVIPNVWYVLHKLGRNYLAQMLVIIRAINHDVEIYGPDADEFNPSRHLDDNGKIKSIGRDMKEDNHGEIFNVNVTNKQSDTNSSLTATFGYGRRICAGR